MAESKEAIEEKKAIIEIGEMCEVKMIPFQFRQLFRNLIGNSLKFSKSDVLPRIRIESELIAVGQLPSLGGQAACHITYIDNGIGFEPHFSKRIFEIFQKLHPKEEYAGTGIGLSIIKKIVENHPGQIIAEGELEKGATFHIYLPV